MTVLKRSYKKNPLVEKVPWRPDTVSSQTKAATSSVARVMLTVHWDRGLIKTSLTLTILMEMAVKHKTVFQYWWRERKKPYCAKEIPERWQAACCAHLERTSETCNYPALLSGRRHQRTNCWRSRSLGYNLSRWIIASAGTSRRALQVWCPKKRRQYKEEGQREAILRWYKTRRSV